VTLCGELASSPIGALALLGLGYRSFSLSPTGVGPVKAMVLDLDVHKLEKFAHGLLAQKDPNLSIRDKLSAFAEAEGLAL
jgi:phosphotransferase system enzyme I (PtsP)